MPETVAQISRGLEFSFAESPSLERIRGALHALRRLIDIYYPYQTPTQRIGHEFAADAIQIVENIAREADSVASRAASLREPQPSSSASSSAYRTWTDSFSPGTELDLTPFEVENLIRARKAQVRDLDDEITLLQRRLNRLRNLDVRMTA